MTGFNHGMQKVARIEECRIARRNRRLTLRSKRIRKMTMQQPFTNNLTIVQIPARSPHMNVRRYAETFGYEPIMGDVGALAKFRHARMVRRIKLNAKRQATRCTLRYKPPLFLTNEKLPGQALTTLFLKWRCVLRRLQNCCNTFTHPVCAYYNAPMPLILYFLGQASPNKPTQLHHCTFIFSVTKTLYFKKLSKSNHENNFVLC